MQKNPHKTFEVRILLLEMSPRLEPPDYFNSNLNKCLKENLRIFICLIDQEGYISNIFDLISNQNAVIILQSVYG